MPRSRSTLTRNVALVSTVLAAFVACTAGLAVPGGTATADAGSAEQQLVDRFAPVIMIKSQDAPCDTDGEQYAPTAADIVLDNPEVLLRQVGQSNPVMMRAPGAADLYGLGEGFFIDFPGSSLEPGCIYETDFHTFAADTPATVYAHIARQADRPDQLVVQYWSYWYYNDWNNKHESDWEGIQLLFDASSVEEALASEPVSVGYAQHEGGERADWNSSKLDRDGDHPVVYSSAGSHASYFGSALYLGRSASEGFGCDNTDGPSTRLDPVVTLLPDTVDDPDDPLAWLMYHGRWGERQNGSFNAPTGPMEKPRWSEPVSWHDDLRANAVVVPGGDGEGSAIVSNFCSVVEAGSGALIKLSTSPARLLATLLVIGLLVAWVVGRTDWSRVEGAPLTRRRRAGQILRAALGSYRRRPDVLLVFGLVYLPTSLVVAGVVSIGSLVPLVRNLLNLAGRVSETSVLFALVAGSFASLVSYIAVNAMVAAYYVPIARGQEGSAPDAIRLAWSRRRDLATGFLRSTVIVTLLMVSVVGIPWGIRQLIRYQFLAQAVVLDDLHGVDALARSSMLVRSRWFHTAVFVIALNVLGVIVGTTLGLLLLVLVAGLPLWLFSVLVTLVFALIVPVTAEAITLLYGDAVAESQGAEAAEPVTRHAANRAGYPAGSV